jgi:hypothetical protein
MGVGDALGVERLDVLGLAVDGLGGDDEGRGGVVEVVGVQVRDEDRVGRLAELEKDALREVAKGKF